MSRRGALVAVVALVALLVGAAAQASAHPLGNFTVNSYLRVEASGGELYLRQVVDMAEIPTFRERSTVQADGGLQPYAAARAAERVREIDLTVNGRRATVVPISQTASLRPGAGGLQVLRYSAWYRATGIGVGAGSSHRLAVSVGTYAGRIGWHELLVRTSSGARLTDSSVGTKDVADELRSYPGGLLKSPLHVTSATATWIPGRGAGAVAPLTADPESTVEASSPSGLSGLVTGDLSVGVVILALLLAMGWGALHSLSPGHGKTMVAAYLVGTRGTARHALLLGPVRDRDPHDRRARPGHGDAVRLALHPSRDALPLDQPGRRARRGGHRGLGGWRRLRGMRRRRAQSPGAPGARARPRYSRPCHAQRCPR